jgi:hypothetical protein
MWRHVKAAETNGTRVWKGKIAEVDAMMDIGEIIRSTRILRHIPYFSYTALRLSYGTACPERKPPVQRIIAEHGKLLDLIVHVLVHFRLATQKNHRLGIPGTFFSPRL